MNILAEKQPGSHSPLDTPLKQIWLPALTPTLKFLVSLSCWMRGQSAIKGLPYAEVLQKRRAVN